MSMYVLSVYCTTVTLPCNLWLQMLVYSFYFALVLYTFIIYCFIFTFSIFTCTYFYHYTAATTNFPCWGSSLSYHTSQVWISLLQWCACSKQAMKQSTLNTNLKNRLVWNKGHMTCLVWYKDNGRCLLLNCMTPWPSLEDNRGMMRHRNCLGTCWFMKDLQPAIPDKTLSFSCFSVAMSLRDPNT